MNTGITLEKLKEHDSVQVHNPTSQEFSWRFNGELYSVGSGEIAAFSKFVAFHLAKHLSTAMIVEQARADAGEEELKNHRSPHHRRISQLAVYDTPERRIALHKILGNIELVVGVISAYPFKGMIGDMKIYENYLKSLEKPKAKKASEKKGGGKQSDSDPIQENGSENNEE